MADVLGTPEEVVGRRAKALREARGWSQQQVARLMADNGFSWRQTTVAKTEAADRPVRINEAAGLASVFGVTLNDLLTIPIDDYATAHAAVHVAELTALSTAARQRLQECERDAGRANEELEDARAEVERLARELAAAKREFKEAAEHGEQEHTEAPQR